MGKGIKDWTDRDYAQAAIDMLPGTVEEIRVFLRAQGAKASKVEPKRLCSTCPIAQWVNKWTDNRSYVESDYAYQANGYKVPLPVAAMAFIDQFDTKVISL